MSDNMLHERFRYTPEGKMNTEYAEAELMALQRVLNDTHLKKVSIQTRKLLGEST